MSDFPAASRQDRDPPVDGERFDVDSSAGRITVYIAGAGAPLLLIHSINAAASAAEVRPLIGCYRSTRQVFSIDLPGFGLSERSDRAYSPRLMTDAIRSVTHVIRARNHRPIDALAVSLSSEFLARAASEEPALFRTLALVSPTGFSRRRVLRGPTGSTLEKPWLFNLLNGPGARWGPTIFRQLTRPGVIRYFLKRTWGSARIDEELWQADIRMAQSPGAHFAPLHFLSGGLFSADIHTIYEQLSLPVWLCHGTRGDFVDYGQTEIVARRGNWSTTVYDSGALPYFERLQEFKEDYDHFLNGVSGIERPPAAPPRTPDLLRSARP